MALDNICNSPNCPVKEIKDNQVTFDSKLDRIISLLGKQDLLALEISHIKEKIEDIKKDNIDKFEDVKESKAAIWEKLNNLEKNKQNADEVKEHRGWTFGTIIVIISFLLNLLKDYFSKKG